MPLLVGRNYRIEPFMGGQGCPLVGHPALGGSGMDYLEQNQSVVEYSRALETGATRWRGAGASG
jgi:hypothetical protein